MTRELTYVAGEEALDGIANELLSAHNDAHHRQEDHHEFSIEQRWKYKLLLNSA